MATVDEARRAIAAALQRIPGIHAYDKFPGRIIPPAAVVRRRRTRYGASFAGGAEWLMAVGLYVQLGDAVEAQELLDAYLSETGPTSVVDALRADPSFGGVVQGSVVTEADEEGLTDFGDGVKYLTAAVNLTVRNA